MCVWSEWWRFLLDSRFHTSVELLTPGLGSSCCFSRSGDGAIGALVDGVKIVQFICVDVDLHYSFI